MQCAEKERLMKEYSSAAQGYSDSVAELQQKTGTSQKKEYDRLTRITTETRVKAEQARLAVESHVAAHGC